MTDSLPRSRGRSEILDEISSARSRLAQLEAELASLSVEQSPASSQTRSHETTIARDAANACAREYPLSLREYARYGRQMLINPVGLAGQLKLKNAHILVVGAGGLGCPVLLYLAAAGVGEITILDHDTVELSNLHRQILHTEGRVGMSKAQSAMLALKALNSDIKVHAHEIAFVPSIFHDASTPPSVTTPGTFDLVLDCTDNPATRHFLNAYAVALDVPLVSGGAVRAEGTVGVYGLALARPTTTTTTTTMTNTQSQSREEPPKPDDDDDEQGAPERGPCYACVFPPAPAAPPLESFETELERDLEAQRRSLVGTGACSDEGVLGINCGIVGIAMAAEAVKVLLGIAKPTLHLFSPLSPGPYRTIKTRARKLTCPTCGTFAAPTLAGGDTPPAEPSWPPRRSTRHSRWRDFLESQDGVWPGWSDPLCAVPGVGQRAAAGERGRTDERLTVDELRAALNEGSSRQHADRELEQEQERRRNENVTVVDTRPEPEFGIVNLEGSINIPFAKLLKDPSLAFGSGSKIDDDDELAGPDTIVFVCRRGNDSLLAARALRRWVECEGPSSSSSSRPRRPVRIVDVAGGLTAYAKSEPGFPVY